MCNLTAGGGGLWLSLAGALPRRRARRHPLPLLRRPGAVSRVLGSRGALAWPLAGAGGVGGSCAGGLAGLVAALGASV